MADREKALHERKEFRVPADQDARARRSTASTMISGPRRRQREETVGARHGLGDGVGIQRRRLPGTVGDLGRDAAGMDDGHADGRARQLPSQRIGKAANCDLLAT